jgi:hypothetical protein
VQPSSGLHPLKKYQLNQFVAVSVIDVSDSTTATLAVWGSSHNVSGGQKKSEARSPAS